MLAAPLSAQPKTGGVVKTIEPVRVACINSGAFLDQTSGIKQLVKVAQGLELEFSSTQGELSLLGEKLRTIVGELNKLSTDATGNSAAIAGKQAEGQKLQQELQAKQQAAQEAYSKRAQETQAPIAADISKELRAFAKERDLGLVLDSGQARRGDPRRQARDRPDGGLHQLLQRAPSVGASRNFLVSLRARLIAGPFCTS